MNHLSRSAGRGVGGAIIFSSGYSETGRPERIAQQESLVNISRRSGLRILGPNCIGLINYNIGFQATFGISPFGKPPGPGAIDTELDPYVAMFRSTDRCFAALAAWHQREEWLRSASWERARTSTAQAAAAAAKMIEAADTRVLTEREAKKILATYGVPVVSEQLVRSASEAAAAATAMGFPVALKVASPDLPHKTEAGVVRLGLKDRAELLTAYEIIVANARKVSPAPRVNGVLVQAMIDRGVEVMVGARVDPLFGPVVVVGLGGTMVELLNDTVLELAPVAKWQARAMLERLKGKALLTGFRGSEPVDLDKLAEVVSRLSEFAADQQERIAELDVNPLICSGAQIIAVDALIVKPVTQT